MSFTERRLVQSYSALFVGLSLQSKKELMSRLAQSIENENRKLETDSRFYDSFGAFASEKPAEEIVKEIRESRTFRRKDIEL